jgi:hypothetical protein
MRIKFNKGKQREFLKKVMENTNCPTIKELENRLAGITYSSLKNYFSERRCLSEDLLLDFCKLANLDKNNFSYEKLDENWGQLKGGKKSRR